jgi:hypothetical protein
LLALINAEINIVFLIWSYEIFLHDNVFVDKVVDPYKVKESFLLQIKSMEFVNIGQISNVDD